jgi:S-adenosylmethionine hydrolase
VAARLALGTPIEHAGSPVAPDDVRRLDLPRPRVMAGEVAARVLAVDRFGNLQLNLYRDQLGHAGLLPGQDLRVQVGRRGRRAVHGRTFADAERGETVVFEDSSRAIAVAVNGGSAAETLQAGADSEVKLRPWAG